MEKGILAPERWERYKKLRREALHADDRAAAAREKSARNKEVAMFVKSHKRKKEVW
jgi:hypothetical protein